MIKHFHDHIKAADCSRAQK